MDTLTPKQQIFIIVHECYHIICEHFNRFKDEIKDPKTRYYANIALDCAINQLAAQHFEAPSKIVDLKFFNEITKANALPFETAEYYYDIIINSPYKKGIDELSDILFKMIDNHSGITIPEKFRYIIDKAIEKQKSYDAKHGIGSNNTILKYLKRSEKIIDKNVWKRLINKCFYNTLSNNVYIKYNTPSRRNADSIYGKKRKLETFNVWVILDTSGSIHDNLLSRFCNQINSAAKNGILINLIQCDAEIKKISMNLKQIPNNFEISGRGGTDLSIALQHIHTQSNNKQTRVVVFTDGDTPWKHYDNIDVTAVYTPNHRDLPNVSYSATMY
jgi:predicted metal-dependent peptidase